MDSQTFWRSTPRAIWLLYRCAQKARGVKPTKADKRSPSGQPVERVRMSKIPR